MSEPLTTFAANQITLTSFFHSQLIEVFKFNTQALVLGMTGVDFTADISVTVGHAHEDGDSRLAWRQLATFPLSNQGASGIGSAPNECWDAAIVDAASSVELAICRLFISQEDATQVIPRARVSNDNSATTNCTLTFAFYELDMTTLVATRTIVFSTGTARNRVWVDGTAIDVSAADADADWANRLPLVVVVSGVLAADTEDVAVHELAFGVTP